MAHAGAVARADTGDAAPRIGGAVLAFPGGVPASRRHAVGPAPLGSPEPAATADMRPARRPLVAALAASAGLHAVVVAALAGFVGFADGDRVAPFDPPIVARLVTSSPVAVAVPPPPAPVAPATAARATPLLPVPLEQPAPAPSAKGSSKGQATINPAPEDATIDATYERAIAEFYPHAVRGTLEFEAPPRGIYPIAAVERRLQLDLLVPVVVLEDGRVELARGTIVDRVFAPVIAAGLKDARAKPGTTPDGRTVPLWGVLAYAFEFVGGPTDAK